MEPEEVKEAVNAGQHISTCSASGYLAEGSCEVCSGECSKKQLDGNARQCVCSKSVVDNPGCSSNNYVHGSEIELVTSLPLIDRKDDSVLMENFGEATRSGEECKNLLDIITENDSFQSSTLEPSVNIPSLNEPPHDGIHKNTLLVSDGESENRELVSCFSNNCTNNIDSVPCPDDSLMLKNHDNLASKEVDEIISNEEKHMDLDAKRNMIIEKFGENAMDDSLKENSLGDSSVYIVNEKLNFSVKSEDAKICDITIGRKDDLGREIAGDQKLEGESGCVNGLPFDICVNDTNEHTEIHHVNADNNFNSLESRSQNGDEMNKVSSEVETSVNAFAVKDCGDGQIADENMHSFAGNPDSIELKIALSNSLCIAPLDYRESSDSSSESDLTSSSDDESVTEITDADGGFRKHGRRPEPLCHGEIPLTDLPPIEDLNISVPEEECIKIGEISSIVGEQAVIQALPNTPALDIDSVLFLDHGKTTLGKIFDVLGPVKEPFYTVRFNSENHARERGVTVGADVFCAPKTDHTAFVFLAEMMKMKGSDASWEHNHEPPPLCVDYSDDEQERLARRALAHQRCGDDRDSIPPKKKRGIRHKMGNSNQLNDRNQRGNFVDGSRSDVSPARGYFSQTLPPATSYSPLFTPHPVFPPVAQRDPGGYTGRYNNPSLMFGGPPPNFRPQMRTGYSNPLFGAPLRNFPPSTSSGLPHNMPPSMNSPSPYFIRPFHMMPSVPLVPLPPLPPYLSSPHVRPLLCPPRFRPPMDDQRGPGNF